MITTGNVKYWRGLFVTVTKPIVSCKYIFITTQLIKPERNIKRNEFLKKQKNNWAKQ